MTSLDVGAKSRWGRVLWPGRLSLSLHPLFSASRCRHERFLLPLSSLYCPRKGLTLSCPSSCSVATQPSISFPKKWSLAPFETDPAAAQGRGPEILQAVTAVSWCKTHWEGSRESMGLMPASSFIATVEMTVWHRQVPLKRGGFPMPAEGKLRSFQKRPWKQSYKTGIRKAFYWNYLQTWSNQDNPGWRFKPFCCGKIIFMRYMSLQGKISHAYSPHKSEILLPYFHFNISY